MISFSKGCKKAEALFNESGLRPRFENRKGLTYLLVRNDPHRGLRLYITEEIGLITHVAWISEQDARDWTSTDINFYMHWLAKVKGSYSKPKTLKSSKIHKTKISKNI